MSARILPRALQRGADDVRQIVQAGPRLQRTRLQPRHIQQVADEAVQPVGFLDDGAEQRLLGRPSRTRPASAGWWPTQDRRQGRAQIMRDRRQQRRAQAVRFRLQAGKVQVAARLTRSIASAAWSASASISRCWSGVSSGPGSSRMMPTTPSGPRPVRSGWNSHLAPGNVSEPRPATWFFSHAPFGGGEIGVVQRVLGREAGADGDACRPPAAAARRGPSASARSGARSPIAGRPASRPRPACG